MKTLISYLALATLMLTFSYAVGTQQKLNKQFEAGNDAKGEKAANVQAKETTPVMKADLAGSGVLDVRNWKKSNDGKDISSL